MRIGLQEPDWGYIASVLANTGDDNQIIFFKALVKEMRSWGTMYQAQIQLAGVNRQLSNDEKELLSMLGYSDDET